MNLVILTPTDAFKVFDAMIKPIFCFGSEIWGYQYYEIIEKVHVQFCKRLCNLNQNTTDLFVLGECGRYPMAVHYICNCIKYWTKLITMPDHRFPKQCYNMLRSLEESGRITWASKIKSLLFEHGFGFQMKSVILKHS